MGDDMCDTYHSIGNGANFRGEGWRIIQSNIVSVDMSICIQFVGAIFLSDPRWKIQIKMQIFSPAFPPGLRTRAPVGYTCLHKMLTACTF